MTPRDEARELRLLSHRITVALVVVAVVAMIFSAVSVTRFALDHGVSEWTAWVLDPMICLALLAVLLADARLVELGTAPSGWATCLRWFTGLATLAMNVWSSVWPDGEFGVPRNVDPAGVVLHSVAPVLLVVLAEAATGYRRVIAARLRVLEGAVDAKASRHREPSRDQGYTAAWTPADATVARTTTVAHPAEGSGAVPTPVAGDLGEGYGLVRTVALEGHAPVHTPALGDEFGCASATEVLEGPLFDESWDAHSDAYSEADAHSDAVDADPDAPWLTPWDDAADGLELWARDALAHIPDDPRDAHPDAHPSQVNGLHALVTDASAGTSRMRRTDAPDADALDPDLIERARALDTASRAETGRPASLRRMQTELRIGQARAQQVRRVLDIRQAALGPHSHS